MGQIRLLALTIATSQEEIAVSRRTSKTNDLYRGMPSHMYQELGELERQLANCRRQAQLDSSSPCHRVTQWQCQRNEVEAGLIWPRPGDLRGPVEILVVGINPNWNAPNDALPSELKPSRNTGKTFSKYQQHILSKVQESLPSGSAVAYLDLVPCGTPSGDMVEDVIDRCRAAFFNKVVDAIRPKLIVSIGRYASRHFYRHDCDIGRMGAEWQGLRKKHGAVEQATFGDHRCSIVFVLQPSSHVSMEKRDMARDAIADAYVNESGTLRDTQ